MSNQPTSRWLNLLNLDIVKRRNKPKTLLTVPKNAPFFLPTIPSLDLAFDLEKDQSSSDHTKLLMPGDLSTFTAFGKKLFECKSDENYEKCIEKLKTNSPSSIEAEINSLGPDSGGSIELIKQFLRLINLMLKSNRDFELAQSYLGLFLKTHTKIVAENLEVKEILESVESLSTDMWLKLQNQLMYNICVVKSLKDM